RKQIAANKLVLYAAFVNLHIKASLSKFAKKTMPRIPPPSQPTPPKAFERLLTVLHTLRTECPWDRKQTMETLRHLSIEEMYELGDAILDNDLAEVKKELGDLMMHLVFYARIAEEQGAFD